MTHPADISYPILVQLHEYKPYPNGKLWPTLHILVAAHNPSWWDRMSYSNRDAKSWCKLMKTISWWATMAHLDEVPCPIPMGRPWNIFIGDLIFPILAGYSPWPTLLKSHALFWWDTIYTGIPQSSSWLDSIYPILVICLLRPIIDVSVPILVGPHTLVYPHDPTWWNVMSFCGVPLWPILMGYYVLMCISSWWWWDPIPHPYRNPYDLP